MPASPGPPDESVAAADPLDSVPVAAAGDPAAWLSEVRADEVAAGRTRVAWLARQAGEESTLRGVLLDLAERGAPVVAELADASSVRGTLRAVGLDLAIIEPAGGGTAVLALAALWAVRPSGGNAVVWGDRPIVESSTMQHVLADWSEARPEVTLRTVGGTVQGELVHVGSDVAVVRATDERRSRIYVAIPLVVAVISRERFAG